MGEMEQHPGDPSRMRIGDADRQRVAEVLRDAAGEGRLDLDELDERLEQTWKAKTYAELVPITADLHPVAPAQQPVGAQPAPAPGPTTTIAVMSGSKRRGRWTVADNHTAFAVMGDVLIDLREAHLSLREVTINAIAIMGSVNIILAEQMNVVVDGTPIMGDFHHKSDKVVPQIGPDSPLVKVRGMALMGSVTVQRRPAPGTPRPILGRY